MKISIALLMEKSSNDFKRWLEEYSTFFEEAFNIVKYNRDVKYASSSNYTKQSNEWILFVTNVNVFMKKQLSESAIAFYTRGIINEDDIYDILNAVGYDFRLDAFDEYIKSIEEEKEND